MSVIENVKNATETDYDWKKKLNSYVGGKWALTKLNYKTSKFNFTRLI